MALDADGFVDQFPEFSDISEDAPEAIDNAIRDAKNFVSKSIWGTRYETAVLYKAAHLLAMSPLGEDARDKSGTDSTYNVVFKEMLRALPIRCAVSR
jgi:hypothetical protein